MSSPPQVRRTDRVMTDARVREVLAQGSADVSPPSATTGFPTAFRCFTSPSAMRSCVHNTAARGHLRRNVEHAGKVCFEIDQPGEVFDYGRFECNSSVAYCSVIVFGEIRIVDDRAAKQRFCDALMAKYGKPDNNRPKGFYPRLDLITVYADHTRAHHRQGTRLARGCRPVAGEGHDQVAERQGAVARLIDPAACRPAPLTSPRRVRAPC